MRIFGEQLDHKRLRSGAGFFLSNPKSVLTALQEIEEKTEGHP